MSNTTSLKDEEATPIARLIVKAAMRWLNTVKDNAASKKRAARELGGFAEVACDILDACQTPFAFELAIREATAVRALPNISGCNRDSAAAKRSAWQIAIVADVVDRLQNNDVRPSSG